MTDTSNSDTNNPYSVKALIEWIEHAGNKGLINKTTAGAKKASVTEVLVHSDILQDIEKNDVRKLNPDDVFDRYVNRYSNKYPPDTLKTYRSRMKSSVALFLKYKANPLGFSSRTHKTKTAQKEITSKPLNEVTEPTLLQQPNNTGDSSNQRITTPLPILIGGRNTITIQNFPLDITEEEADAICSVINGFVKKPTKTSEQKLLMNRTDS